MRIIIVDGSQKGIVLGAGLVASDEFGFLSFHSEHRLHIEATPEIAEVFALECAIRMMEESVLEDEVLIVTDCARLETLFAPHAPKIDAKKQPYHRAVQQRLQELRKLTQVTVAWAKPDMQQYVKLAHEQSRTYLRKPDMQRLIATVPFSQRQQRQKGSVLYKDKRWFVFLEDKEVHSGKVFLDTILSAAASLRKHGMQLLLDKQTLEAIQRCKNSEKAKKIMDLIGVS